MKSTHLLLAAAFAFVLPASLHAAKDPAKKAAKKAAKQTVAQYDKNSSGTIDGDEVAAVQQAYTADKTSPLKQFDRDSDGTLSDTEIASIKGGKKKDGKKKNKNQ